MICYQRSPFLPVQIYERGQPAFVGNIAMLPSGAVDFAKFFAPKRLAGNWCIVRCHIRRGNKHKHSRTLMEKKFPPMKHNSTYSW